MMSRVLPGGALAIGITVTGISLVVLLPMASLVAFSVRTGVGPIVSSLSDPRVVAALKLSFWTSLAAAAFASLIGLLVSWVLVRYRFPGRFMVDACIDLPFALPTAVAGISLTSLYAPAGWMGKPLLSLGIPVAFQPLGIVVALVFLGIPFSVRTVQPVLADLDPETEDAAASLGATPAQAFFRVLFPEILPAWVTGFTLAFARALGEYGSVIFIAGNLPMKSEIAPLLIMTRLEQYDYAGAAAVAVVLLLASFLLLLGINRLQRLTVMETA